MCSRKGVEEYIENLGNWDRVWQKDFIATFEGAS
jgi:hypothetical protein